MADAATLQELIRNARESLAVELKAWFDPKTAAGQAKIARFAMAMRNYGGGFMLVGFDDRTGQPVAEHRPTDVRTYFHVDTIQGIVSRFASESFEVTVHFPERDGLEFPVIEVPAGIRTPIASKSSLEDGAKEVVRANRVYVRTLSANDTPSTAEAGWKDWNRLIETCFDNREADIGRFVRRHLSSLSADALRQILTSLSLPAPAPEPTIQERLQAVLDAGFRRYETVAAERKTDIPPHGSFEVAVLVRGAVPDERADLHFRDRLLSSNPNLTGWPAWVDSRNFGVPEDRPYLQAEVWEAFIASFGTGWTSDHLDFWRLSPRPEFYLYRAFQDDVLGLSQQPEPMTQLDFGLPLLRTAEAFAVGLQFAKVLGADSAASSCQFALRWRRLKGRSLSGWAQPSRVFHGGRRAYRDEVLATVDIPLDTPPSGLHAFVRLGTAQLYEAFDGFAMPEPIVEDFTRRLFERRL